jgi:hypothetical protein
MGTLRKLETPLAPNQRRSLDFVSDQLTDGRMSMSGYDDIGSGGEQAGRTD